MVRRRRPEFREPVESLSHGELVRKLISASPSFATEGDALLWVGAFPPPGDEYPMVHEPLPGGKNAYRDWLIKTLEVLIECYPAPVNMALDCLRKSLIEINRGLVPNLFKPAKSARGGKSNFAAQQAMNLAVLAASYIHDACQKDTSYEKTLEDCGTNRREIETWKNKRLHRAYHNPAIMAWYDQQSAEIALRNAILDYRRHSSRNAKPAK